MGWTVVLSQLLWGGSDTGETGSGAHDKEGEQHRQGTGVMGILASPRLQEGINQSPRGGCMWVTLCSTTPSPT